jgi:hypothetical protein
MWKASGKTATVLIFVESFFPQKDKCEMGPLGTKLPEWSYACNIVLLTCGAFVDDDLPSKNKRLRGRTTSMEHATLKNINNAGMCP